MAGLINRNGNYRAQFYDSERTPKRKRLSLGTSRKQVARRLLGRLEDAYALGDFDPWIDDLERFLRGKQRSLTITEAKREFVDEKIALDRSDHTIRAYNSVLGILARHVGEDTPMKKLTPRQIHTVIRDEEIARSTQHFRYRHVKAFLRWCVEKDILSRSPLDGVERPKRPDKLPKAITQDQLTAVCDALRADYEEKLAVGHCREGQLVWHIPLFWFGLYTGMRASELARLRWEHIDFDRRLIYIYEQKNAKEQTIPLNRKAREVLTDVRGGDPNDFVFRSPSFERQDRSIRAFAQSVSVTFCIFHFNCTSASVSLHSLRHGFCIMLAEAGKSAVVIKEAARHADIAMSVRYVHLANERLKGELDDVFG